MATAVACATAMHQGAVAFLSKPVDRRGDCSAPCMPPALAGRGSQKPAKTAKGRDELDFPDLAVARGMSLALALVYCVVWLRRASSATTCCLAVIALAHAACGRLFELRMLSRARTPRSSSPPRALHLTFGPCAPPPADLPARAFCRGTHLAAAPRSHGLRLLVIAASRSARQALAFTEVALEADRAAGGVAGLGPRGARQSR
jgi:hypothetical protein